MQLFLDLHHEGSHYQELICSYHPQDWLSMNKVIKMSEPRKNNQQIRMESKGLIKRNVGTFFLENPPTINAILLGCFIIIMAIKIQTPELNVRNEDIASKETTVAKRTSYFTHKHSLFLWLKYEVFLTPKDQTEK